MKFLRLIYFCSKKLFKNYMEGLPLILKMSDADQQQLEQVIPRFREFLESHLCIKCCCARNCCSGLLWGSRGAKTAARALLGSVGAPNGRSSLPRSRKSARNGCSSTVARTDCSRGPRGPRGARNYCAGIGARPGALE